MRRFIKMAVELEVEYDGDCDFDDVGDTATNKQIADLFHLTDDDEFLNFAFEPFFEGQLPYKVNSIGVISVLTNHDAIDEENTDAEILQISG